ncbi:MAG: SH3 domain-containing protein [Phycisphaerae bacterium]
MSVSPLAGSIATSRRRCRARGARGGRAIALLAGVFWWTAPASNGQPGPATQPGSPTAPADDVLRPLLSATTQSATQPADEISWLRVTGARVNVRSRPDPNAFILGQVERDTALHGAPAGGGWHRIEPPPGFFSYVAAEFVQALGDDAGVVAVKSGTLRVRAGSLLVALDPARSDVQTRLAIGEHVRILAREGAWLRIEPPADAHMYISSAFVAPISVAEANRLRAASAPTTAPAGQPATTPAPADGGSAPSAPLAARVGGDGAGASTRPADLPGGARPVVSVIESPWQRRLRAAEARIDVEASKPRADADWSGVLRDLEPIAAQREDAGAARIATAWQPQIEARHTEQALLRQVRDIAQRDADDQRRFEAELARVQRDSGTAAATGYTVEGALGARSLPASANAGARFPLRAPGADRVIAYLEFHRDWTDDPNRFVGHLVGVRGARRFDAVLAADVVLVESIVVLHEPTTQPARSTP